MEGYTRFKRVAAEKFLGNLTGSVIGRVSISKEADYALTEEEKMPYIGITLGAASKTVTLGLEEGRIAFVHNAGGTNAFTVKNVSGDSGASLAAGKVALVVGGKAANSSVVLVLN